MGKKEARSEVRAAALGIKTQDKIRQETTIKSIYKTRAQGIKSLSDFVSVYVATELPEMNA